MYHILGTQLITHEATKNSPTDLRCASRLFTPPPPPFRVLRLPFTDIVAHLCV